MFVGHIIRYGVAIIILFVTSVVIAKKYAIPDISFFPKEYPPRQGWNSHYFKMRDPNLKMFQFLSKNYRFVNWLIVVCSFIIAIWMFFCALLPLLRDIPFERDKSYCVIEGIALDNDLSGQRTVHSSRTVRLEDRDGMVVRIQTIYTAIYKGNTYLAYYLPNSKIAPYFELVDEH